MFQLGLRNVYLVQSKKYRVNYYFEKILLSHYFLSYIMSCCFPNNEIYFCFSDIGFIPNGYSGKLHYEDPDVVI